MICWTTQDQFLELLRVAVATLREKRTKEATRFDVIICSGMSGVIMASPVAAALKVPLIVVRREMATGDKPMNGHVGMRHILEGDPEPYTYVPKKITKRLLFLDDHVSGANTFKRCLAAIRRFDAEATIPLLYEYNYTIKELGSGGYPPDRYGFHFASEHPVTAVRLAVNPPEPTPAPPEAGTKKVFLVNAGSGSILSL